MSVPHDGGPAFPGEEARPSLGGSFRIPRSGMSLRDYFAGQALAGLLASSPGLIDDRVMAFNAYAIADAMIAARDGS